MTFFSEVWHHMDHAKNICNVNDKQPGPQTHEIVEIVSKRLCMLMFAHLNSTHLKSLFNLFWGTYKCITKQMPILFVLWYYFLNPRMMLEIEVKSCA